jgi:hypothetical protein
MWTPRRESNPDLHAGGVASMPLDDAGVARAAGVAPTLPDLESGVLAAGRRPWMTILFGSPAWGIRRRSAIAVRMLTSTAEDERCEWWAAQESNLDLPVKSRLHLPCMLAAQKMVGRPGVEPGSPV